jgi:predicted nucleic acid-binding protein
MKKILIDTSVWIEFFNIPDSKNTAIVKNLLTNDLVVLAGPIVLELYQGAGSTKDLKKLEEIIDVLEILQFEQKLWKECGELASKLKIHGFTVKTIDIIIAGIAMHNKCKIFSLDNHFVIISKYSNLELFEMY